MNLLPGLRELRAPLVSGYLWLFAAWLGSGHAGWLPDNRPSGNGEVARLWDLGGTLGKTTVLAAVTFIAYLLGSFLEIQPDGSLARTLTPFVLFERKRWYSFYEKDAGVTRVTSERVVERTADTPPRPEVDESGRIVAASWLQGDEVARFLSREARLDLSDLLERRGRIPRRLELNFATYTDDFDEKLLDREKRADAIISRVIEEMPQLASRLLVKNKDLYSKYDRHMAEAAFRINVSIPLTVLLILAVWLSSLPLWVEVVLTLVALAFGLMLFRQGFLRTVAARDVIAQALSIDEVKSRHIPPEEGQAKNSSKKPVGSKEPTELTGAPD